MEIIGNDGMKMKNFYDQDTYTPIRLRFVNFH